MKETLSKESLFDDPIKHISQIKGYYYIVDIFASYVQGFSYEVVESMFFIGKDMIDSFFENLQKNNFVTYKQIELMVEILKIFHSLTEPEVVQKFESKKEYEGLCLQVVV